MIKSLLTLRKATWFRTPASQKQTKNLYIYTWREALNSSKGIGNVWLESSIDHWDPPALEEAGERTTRIPPTSDHAPCTRPLLKVARACLAQAQNCLSLSCAGAVTVGWRSWFLSRFPLRVTKPCWCGSWALDPRPRTCMWAGARVEGGMEQAVHPLTGSFSPSPASEPCWGAVSSRRDPSRPLTPADFTATQRSIS